MIRTNTVMKLLTTVALTVATAFAQSSDRLPVTDWKSAKDGGGHEFHVGLHLMIVGPHQDEFQGFNRDAM